MNPQTPNGEGPFPPQLDWKLMSDCETLAGARAHRIHELLSIYRNSLYLFERTGQEVWRVRFSSSELALRQHVLAERLAQLAQARPGPWS